MSYILRLLCVIVSLSSLFSCGKRELIVGHIEGLTNDTLLLYIQSMNSLKSSPYVDTVVVKDGSFTIYPREDSTHNSVISIYPLQADSYIAGQLYRPESMVITVLSPYDKSVELHANIKGDNQWIEFYAGGRENVELSKVFNTIKPYQARVSSIDREIGRFYTHNIPKSTLDSLVRIREVVEAEISSIKKDAVLRSRSDLVAGYMLTQTPYDFAYDNYETISEQVRNSILKPMLDLYINSVIAYITTELNSSTIVAGVAAPDFSLPRVDSTNFTLSSLRGRYVVLSFWTSWSSWCTREFEPMIDYYLGHWRHVEFVGINSQESWADWVKGIADNELPWTNVRNIEADIDSNVVAMYGVKAYPTKFIINPEGVIVDKIVGNDPDLFRKISTAIHENL